MPEEYEPHEGVKELPDWSGERNRGSKKRKMRMYGANVRALFVFIALLLLIFLPYVRDGHGMPTAAAATIILAVTFIAACTASRFPIMMFVDGLISLCGAALFIYRSILDGASTSGLAHLVNEILAVAFLISFYFAIRTIRSYIELSRAKKRAGAPEKRAA